MPNLGTELLELGAKMRFTLDLQHFRYKVEYLTYSCEIDIPKEESYSPFFVLYGIGDSVRITFENF